MTAGSDIRDLLGMEDAFASYGFDPSRVDLQGWNSSHSFFRDVITRIKPTLIIGFGAWKGMSSIHLARR